MMEFSRQIPLEAITLEKHVNDFDASAHECQALAARFGLVAIEALSGRTILRRLDKQRIRLEVQFRAAIVQMSVVTLEPIRQKIDVSFGQDYLLSGTADEALDSGGENIDLEGEDPPELVESDAIDFGEAVVQRLALALDPYPVEATLSDTERSAALGSLISEAKDSISIGLAAGVDDGGERTNPFEVLRNIKLNG